MSTPAILSAASTAVQDLVAPATPSGKDPKEAAKQFEGMLMANLFQVLRKTVHSSGLLGDGGSAKSTYEYLLDQAVVGHAMDAGRTWGLRDRLEASLAAGKKK